ncbi:hypothetical protein CNE_1c29630 [Cupriavidus necator N-1]|uniref:Uncharacterized protein n=1 Tax=Cupriavidus necator (strain ATCC 43291 / DSM 13513 / CCUG 52238 / LMG 8453 / N-1) TaxID=1042878 RepID=G0EV35_CUPNN|nr:hypothetical protein [Cupriavidus necator]AEI78275.1 hypothetical protein CNE_1c29630 [Cupriavidus necator N-1]KAI3598747.1 hypothetical protein D8I24_5693 [Cupriavidus necator H850]MDX6013199.1 hypothetical protein [Cupriavidus necator]
MRLSRIAAAATALAVAGVLASAPAAHAALTADAAAAAAETPLYLPASPADPGGLLGYDHSFQIDFAYEAEKGKSKATLKALKDELKAKKPKKLKAGAKVKAGTYTLAPAPGAEPD